MKGKIVLVTGGGGGLGAGIVSQFLERGAEVVVVDIDEEALASLIPRLPEAQRSHVRPVVCDVSRASDVASTFAVIETTYGTLDVLINNAGIAHGPWAEQPFLATDEVMWDRIMAVNLKSVYLCSHAAARIMKRNGGGVIINMSTAGATRAHRNRVAYDAAKGAIESATRALALDLAPVGIRVNAVAPGMISVPNRTPIGDEAGRDPGDVVPLGRPGTPADVARATAFLASPDASYITGISLPVDGGLLAQLRSPAVDSRVR